jgi:hypothetical protein
VSAKKEDIKTKLELENEHNTFLTESGSKSKMPMHFMFVPHISDPSGDMDQLNYKGYTLFRECVCHHQAALKINANF